MRIFNPPRLLYLGDVPIEPTYAGSALLYRLLDDYLPEHLKIIQANLIPSQGGPRLTNVSYQTLDFEFPRLQFTRFSENYKAWNAWRSTKRAASVQKMLSGFMPEAVLTVTHGCSWLTAAAYARRHQLPLHLILHDEWSLPQHPKRIIRQWAETQFRRVYQQAASRLCVSPFMEELYRKRYGVAGTVLYPARAMDAITYAHPPDRLTESRESLVCGYAGSINSSGYLRALRDMAEALADINGSLLIFGPMTRERAAAHGLTNANIRWEGMVNSNELIHRMREEVDFLFAPMSFDEQDRYNMEISFPSKLTDYTAMGLPILVYGPSYASAVRWAKENTDAAFVIDSEKMETMNSVVKRLLEDATWRVELAKGAIRAGKHFFSHASAKHVFENALAN